MDCIIVYRVNGGKAETVLDAESAELFVFPDYNTALAYAHDNALFQTGQANYQILRLDEI